MLQCPGTRCTMAWHDFQISICLHSKVLVHSYMVHFHYFSQYLPNISVPIARSLSAHAVAGASAEATTFSSDFPSLGKNRGCKYFDPVGTLSLSAVFDTDKDPIPSPL